ncbi:of very long chain fatty acids protein 6 [Seminavis robusta]|uniref:Elongation of fatty acids protein n=1 Tax=Seminavis robusta TaxID=568900 RepID=A0A9N8DQ41_9STRA|nr:of very long chain fatty acids protein 6 [Seminavis robusta]|eukprot:Sro272_g104770.1 of very long chain fatty acids protein 6 (295) ;mRNA; f:10445-11781
MAASADACTGYDSLGNPYQEFSCTYPFLAPFYFEFEKYRDPLPALHWMQDRPFIPIVAVILYGIGIYYGPKLMENRESWNCKKTLAAWNLFLSVFSFMGAARTVPHVLHDMMNRSVRDCMCADARMGMGSGSTGLWLFLFAWSKFPELIDTFFLIVHKKNVLFLHWYHHITVLLYTWYGFTNASPIGCHMTAMNFTVHAVMYFYYFLMAIKMKPKWFNPMWITFMQISQMIGGCIVTVLGYQYWKIDPDCTLNDGVVLSGFLMYGSYLYLFCQFFVGRFITPRFSASVKKQKTV